MRNRSWLVIGLGISLAVNLALGGFVAGRLLHPGPIPAMMDPSLSLFRVIHQLPEPRRDAFRATLRRHFHTLRGDIRRLREAQHDINDALQRQPFEPQALDAALDRFRDALMAGQRDNQALLVKVATAMTPEERQALLQAMTRARPPHFHGRPAADDRFRHDADDR